MIKTEQKILIYIVRKNIHYVLFYYITIYFHNRIGRKQLLLFDFDLVPFL